MSGESIKMNVPPGQSQTGRIEKSVMLLLSFLGWPAIVGDKGGQVSEFRPCAEGTTGGPCKEQAYRSQKPICVETGPPHISQGQKVAS